MKKIIKEKTKDFPSFEIEGNTLEIKGEFIPKNDGFFEEIKKEVGEIQELVVNIPLFNGLSKRFLADLMDETCVLKVNWYFFDEDTLEIGKIFSELFPDLDFILIQSSENPKLFE
jgi:hypothetical protein